MSFAIQTVKALSVRYNKMQFYLNSSLSATFVYMHFHFVRFALFFAFCSS